MESIITTRKTNRSLAALAAIAAIVSSSASASAAVHGNATVTLVNASGTNAGAGSPGIYVRALSGTSELVFITSITIGGACSIHAQTTDSMNKMLSVATAAMLSGKRVDIFYNACGGANYIAGISLLP